MTGRELGGASRDPRPDFNPVAIGTDIQRRIGVKTSRDEPLARFTTMRVGGPADLFAVAHNAFELRALVKFVRSRGIPHVILGRGSDVVIADAGVRGLVIQVRAEGTEVDEDRLVAEAGVAMARAATVTQGASLSGLEFGLAIPGTVGGSVWANAGAHESDVRAVLESALVMGADGAEVRLDREALALGYRDSRLKHRPDPAAPPEVVVSATFRLSGATPDEIRARLDDIRRWRQAHQPLGIPSAGSYFRNPRGDSAGRLIEAAGLKGTRRGGASVSDKHANFVINDRKGTADDVRRLGELVRAEVRARFGVELEPEVVFVGDWGPAWTETVAAPTDPVETDRAASPGSAAGGTVQ
ncbi:MAG: UDP-N-acetylmuramate dehydrogenase [Chloroflexota bacterium]|jgi:UDP-N-acetylmuramate dehydrogenase|nr:UDP-N-acetylmuramate dehydrogenase [Chloroflexota bacterium]